MLVSIVTAIDREHLRGCTVVASVSGGKDSAALSLWLTEQGIEHLRVFADTGWEHAATYEYLRGPLTAKLGPIVEVRGKAPMADLIRKRGMFPSRLRRFCTQELKVFPIRDYLNGLGREVVNAVGIRHAESAARALMPRWDRSDGFDCEVWRPLVAWTEQDVIDIHARHGLRPNPLYLKGAARVGCWPCIYARKAEIKLVAEIDPERINQIRQLEADVAGAASARAEARGETLANPPAFFQAKYSDEEGGYPAWSIDRVVEWSRTGRGGRQFLLFDAPADEGCVRWGLCETREQEGAP